MADIANKTESWNGHTLGEVESHIKSRLNADESIVGFYTCGTAAATVAKVVAASNYVLTDGGSIKIKFTYANSVASPTLNINSTGAKAIVYNGTVASATNTWKAGDVVEFYYDPTYNSNVGAYVGIPTVVTTPTELSQLGQQVIYDVTKNNPTAGPDKDGKFESLSALLLDANLSTLIPSAVRCGGMSIRFVQSSDNKYVQYRLMSDTFNTTPANWQGVDGEPTAGSNNLVKSGGVDEQITLSRDVFNINSYENKSDSYGNTEAAYNIARGAVPVKYRKVGLVITFLTDYGWIEEQFVGSSDLDLSVNTNWWNANNWRINGDVINVNKLTNNYSTVFESLRNAAIAVVNTGLAEYRKKGATLLFKYGERRRMQTTINSKIATSSGVITLTLGSNIYTVSYVSGETAGSILGKIAALSADGFAFTYTPGNSYLYIDSLTFGFVNILVRNNGGISLSTRLIKKGLDETWLEFSFDYSGDAVSDYWSNESYWKELTKCNYIEDYLYKENYTEVGDILYDAHNVPYRWSVIWEDYTTGIFELKDWDASNNMYKGYEVTYGDYKLVQPSVTVLNHNITKVPYRYVQKS